MSAELQTVAEYFMTPQLQYALDQQDGIALHIEIGDHERTESPVSIFLEAIAAQYLVRDVFVMQKGRLAWYGSDEYAGSLTTEQRLQGFFGDFDITLAKLGSYESDGLSPAATIRQSHDRIASLHKRGSAVLLRHLAAVAPSPADRVLTAGALIMAAHRVRSGLESTIQTDLARRQTFSDVAELLNDQLDRCSNQVMAVGRHAS